MDKISFYDMFVGSLGTGDIILALSISFITICVIGFLRSDK